MTGGLQQVWYAARVQSRPWTLMAIMRSAPGRPDQRCAGVRRSVGLGGTGVVQQSEADFGFVLIPDSLARTSLASRCCSFSKMARACIHASRAADMSPPS